MSNAPATAAPAVSPSDVISFPGGIPGFESCRRFVVSAGDEQEPLRRLDAVDGPPASFLAIDPRVAMENYRCVLSDSDLRRLGADREDALLWLALVMVEESGAVTVNLRAPIVINPRTMVGQQVMPHDCLYPVRHVLLAAE